MIANERDLFGDEQAYIAWKRQQEREAKAEAFRAAEARKKRRRVKYSNRILKALNMVAYYKRMQAIKADPERYAQHKSHNAQWRRLWRARNPERARAINRRSHAKHRDTDLLTMKAWYRENTEHKQKYNRNYNQANKERIRAKRSERYERNREAILTKQRRWQASHRSDLNARQRVYYAERREQINAERRTPEYRAKRRALYMSLTPDQQAEQRARHAANTRARYAAKKAAQQCD